MLHVAFISIHLLSSTFLFPTHHLHLPQDILDEPGAVFIACDVFFFYLKKIFCLTFL